MVRNKDGKILTNQEEVRQKWKEHFTEVLNRPHPEQTAEILSEAETIEEIPLGPITKAEIRSAIISMSAGKLPGTTLKLTLRQQLMYFMTFFVQYGIVRLFQSTGEKNLIVRLAKKPNQVREL